jgi:hypothetical protein
MQYCSAAFLDISQAFDKVWDSGLLYKLRQALPLNYSLLLKSYLHNGRFRVKVGNDYSHQLSGCRFYSKIDLVRAYNQIPVHPRDIQKTAITTPFGLFEFPFMSFGLRNAAQTFQRFMDEVLRGLDFDRQRRKLQ